MEKRSRREVLDLFEKYQGLISRGVHPFLGRAGILERDDLWAAAQIGLYLAAVDFENDRGCTFVTYAISRIRWMIIHEIHQVAPYGKKHNETRIKRGMGTPIYVSIDELGDFACPAVESSQAQIELHERSDVVQTMIRELPPKLRMVLEQRFVKGRTLASIAGDIGVSRERVRQIEEEALDKLRAGFQRLEGEP